jgi:diguanylate cyclase (GGDEF)-like protein/PAS domain S-box-containing protein
MNDPLRIMLILDDSSQHGAIARVLHHAFPLLQLKTILQREEFVAASTENPWDLIIASGRLWPDGGEILREIKSRIAACPAIVLAPSEEVIGQTIEPGIEDYVQVSSGQLASMPAIARLMLGQQRQRLALHQAELRYRTLFDGMVLGLYRTSPEGKVLEANPAMQQILGYPDQEGLLTTILSDLYVDVEDRRRWVASMNGEGIVRNFELQLQRYDGSVIWVENNARAIYGSDGRALHYEGSMENITERKWTEQRLSYLAYYDALTGLPNRTLFNDRLRQTLLEGSRDARMAAVLFLDLDRFKYINDTLGHETGDLVLKAVGTRLGASVLEGVTVARISGDEFGIILNEIVQVDDAAKAAQHILDSFRQPFYTADRELFITPSIGIALFPYDSKDAEGLLKNAEVAMYRAKEHRRDNYQYYASDMTAAVFRHLAMEHALRRALEREEFVLYYQPQVQLATGQIVGVEALLRWQRADGDVVSPGEFIPLAEETGLIVPLGEWALRTACAQNKAWQNDGLPPLRVSVNLSGRQFQQTGLPEVISGVLAETGLAPHYLELELTESVLMQNTEVTVSSLRKLNAMGIRISVDDFGTGYSSLSYLKRFPIDMLKIDQSFVQDITVDADDAAITTAIIAMAHSLGIQVIAEGVETEAQVQFLRTRGSEVVQGYYFGRPVTAGQFAQILQPIRH